MRTEEAQVRRFMLLAASVLAVTLVGCGGAASQAPAGSSGAEPTDAPASIDPGGGGAFPAACSVLTAADWEAVVGNPVEDGAPNGTFVCDWGSEPEQTSGSLLLQPGVERDLCISANSAAPIDGFAEPGVWAYDTALNIPGGSLTLCVGEGFATVVVTGGIGAADDEASYRSMAEEIMKLVLSRL
jgi:hypothetical protein